MLFCERQWALIHIEGLWAENRLTVDADTAGQSSLSPTLVAERSRQLAMTPTSTINAPQREAPREKWTDEDWASETNVARGRQAYIVVGRPASGKSRLLADPLTKRKRARLRDTDKIALRIPETEGGKNAMVTHEGASDHPLRPTAPAHDRARAKLRAPRRGTDAGQVRATGPAV